MRKWLFVVCNIAFLAALPAFVYAQGIGGGYVVDPAISVPANSYTTFSTVYNGKRYYLGVDTVQAKAGKDTVAVYSEPCYAAMWVAGPLWSPTGEKLDNKDYTRTVKSVWLTERITDPARTKKFLSVGPYKKSYSPLILTDTANSTLWHTEKDFSVTQYMQGFTYAYLDESGVETYRYLEYDPVYGYSRLYETHPAVSQRISVWDRKTGEDLRFDFRPETHVFGLEMERTTTILPLTAKVTFYENVDRFRSRDARIDVFTKDPTVIDNQETLIGAPYYLTMYYEWASNPRRADQHPATLEEFRNDTYDGNSHMQYWNTYDHQEAEIVKGAWRDTTLMHIRNFKFTRNEDNTFWRDTLYTVGTSPFDRPESRFLRPEGEPGSDPGEGLYVDHSDWLRVYFSCKGTPYKDSALVMRQTFHNIPFTRLTSSVSPADHVFPYKPSVTEESDTAATFTVTIRYVEGNRIVFANGNTERTVLGEEQVLDIASLPKVIFNGREYDTLKVEALLPNGSSAIYDAETNPSGWIESVRLVAGNKIRVKVKPQPDKSPNQRTAQLQFSYNYMHSTALGDTVLTKRSIWLTQKSAAEGDAQIYAFNHRVDTLPQPVHTKHTTLYAIPGQDLQLALHRDHWGYYRWYEWDYRGGMYEKDVANSKWNWVTAPVNELEEEFMVINHVSDPSSRGRWDVLVHNNGHFSPGTSTDIPSIDYPNSDDKRDSIACDVSAYTNIDTLGVIGTSLTSLTEPTLSYRQIFDIRPAKEQADKMADCRVNGGDGHNKWMEDKIIIAPATRAITLSQQYPVSDKATSDVEDQLQYIYYFNPDAEGTADISMGTKKGDVATTATACYARIGRKYKSGVTLRRAKLITKSDLDAMNTNDTLNVFMANPRKEKGYLFGGTSSEQKAYYSGVFKGRTDTADLRKHLESDILNANVNYNNYKLSLIKTGEDSIKLISYTSGQELYAHKGLFGIAAGVDWGQTSLQANNSTIQYAAFTSTSSDRIEKIDNALLELKMSAAILWAYDGSLTAYDGSNASLHLDKGSTDINKGWCFYQIIEPVTADHYETPRWYKKASGDADWVCIANGDSTAAGYTMLDNGYLQIDQTVHKNANETIQYCLKTQHFHLAKFTLVTRNVDAEGPAERAIIPVETMENQYDILFSMTTESGHFPWEQSEMSYHYPTSDIDEDHRVIIGDEPAKGEYAFLQSFRGINAISGTAATDYLLCLNAAEKPVQFMNFEYPQLICSDQQLYFTAEICNPIQNGYNPQITAEMEGYNGSTWVPIYRYVTGELPYDDGKWYQVVMPIAQSDIRDYKKFRFIGYLTGSSESEAFVLLDHMRFIAKVRPLSIFQNRSTCLDADEKIDIVARLDYKNATFGEDALVAYQYQKLNKSTHEYEAMAATGEGAVTYINDSGDGTKTDTEDKACGVIRIPKKNYNPADPEKGDPSAIRPIGGVTSTTRSYVNEAASGAPYWTMYISQKVSASPSDTFRVAMAVILDEDDKPNFVTSGCATERILGVKKPVELHVDGSEWTAERSAAKVVANNTYRVKAVLTDATLPEGSRAGSGTCKFDILRSTETVDYNTLIAAWQAAMAGGDADAIATAKDAVDAADAAFLVEYGVNHSDLLDYLEIFRSPASPHAETSNWNDVHPLDFTYSGRSEEESRKIYNVLDKLIARDHKLQIAVDYHDVFLGSDDNIYFHLHPIPASGRYINGFGEEETIEVCNSPIWFEMHSDHADYQLRLGYDNIINGNYQTPVIRATVTDANEHLKVRIAAITHSGATGVLIGWDSTQVVDSNDPEWLAGGESFRYHQDRIAQSDIFANYYQIPEEDADTDPRRFVVFRPVTSAYVDSLGWTTCPCYDYDPSGTVHGTEGTGHDLTKQTDSGCNPWGVKPRAKGDIGADSKAAPHPMPGHRAANTMSLKAGYWYRFRTAFFNMSGTVVYNATDDVGINHAEFILVVAPDTVRWTPSHPESANYWNDDNNWTPVMKNAPADGYRATVPMGNTKVIIPQVGEGMLPIVADAVVDDKNTIEYGYASNTCEKILFKPNAQMLGQEKLNYEKAFVDVHFTTGEWQTFSPALEDIYSGDMYIPFSTSYNSEDSTTGRSIDTEDFNPKQFPFGGDFNNSYNPREYPFAFYQGFYNAAVPVPFYNTDTEDKELTNDSAKSKSAVDWVKTPSMAMEYKPGSPCIIQGFDATDEDGRDIVVRLPKSDNQYYGYGKFGENYIAGEYINITRTHISHNLAYDQYATGFDVDEGLSYTLKNLTSADLFFFGNPTMALVDVWQLCKDNFSVLKHEGDTYHFTAYQLMNGSNYTTKTITGPGQYFIAPQRAIGLIADGERTELSIKLTPSALVAITGEGIVVSNPKIVEEAPKRIARTKSVYEEPEKKWLYITASNETDWGIKKSYLTLGEQNGANRGYVFGEDALNISSGLNYYDDASFSTPLSLYTIADNQALMQDVRDTLVSVPLIFTTLEDYSYDDHTLLSFSMNGTWDKPLYLFDALTNDSILIRNGLQVAIQTPNSDQIRYFINGTPKATNNDNQPGVTTDLENPDTEIPGFRDTDSTIIYDILGRKVMTLSEFDLISNIRLPIGVYIIQRGNKTERMVIR